jgi:hypothetical protein
MGTETLGMDTPARCAACQNCKECKFRAEYISFNDNKEYDEIINGLKLDVETKKQTVSYPFCVLPWTLIDNFRLARKGMEMQERRLIKSGQLEEFNSQLHDNVERGVFQDLRLKEITEYTAHSATLPWWIP